MRRREFIASLGAAGTYAAVPRVARGQQDTRVRSLAILVGGDENQAVTTNLATFRNELAKLGWVEGSNLQIDLRFSRGDPDRLTADAEELVNLRPDVIFAYSGPAAGAVQQRTSVIPIVFGGGGDPTRNGLVRDIARPEGNMTGFANSFGSQGGKWLELFKEAVPRLTRVADIFFANELTNRNETRSTIPAAAAQRGVTIIRMPVRSLVEIEHAITAFAAEADGGLLLTGPGPYANVEAIGRLALYYHLPLMYGGSARAAKPEGFLMAHSPDLRDLARRTSSYVDRVNLKTAKAIGVTIPEAFLAQADGVIE